MTDESATARAAALLRQLDENRQLESTSRVACIEPGCRSELICSTSRHVANLEASWRCLEHRQDPSTTKRGMEVNGPSQPQDAKPTTLCRSTIEGRTARAAREL